ncbi:4-oxalocrotonate tautomerase [Wenjunlia vitaminophila]|uniref:4-oxalocrotonate tautomerase n=1 Tax=Wenjunlia vitaminophila TaxID=76728 RepID=A0A0T6LPL6_WENVI|nr:4-oxalocrotonate tautomerase family protein [Wenjunlia vitaminophila]KRV47857.1 4-oxalocrotonate tautomerase [Wenjunlia vitaminophila]
MPLIEVSLVEGRAPEQLRALITGLTEAAETALGAPRSSIRVILREVPATHWAAGDMTIEERREHHGPHTAPH